MHCKHNQKSKLHPLHTSWFLPAIKSLLLNLSPLLLLEAFPLCNYQIHHKNLPSLTTQLIGSHLLPNIPPSFPQATSISISITPPCPYPNLSTRSIPKPYPKSPDIPLSIPIFQSSTLPIYPCPNIQPEPYPSSKSLHSSLNPSNQFTATSFTNNRTPLALTNPSCHFLLGQGAFPRISASVQFGPLLLTIGG